MNSKLNVCGLLLGLGLALSSGAQARTWMVEKDGSGDFTIVQDALDVAASGDTVRIGAGRFDDFAVAEGIPNLAIIAHVKSGNLVLQGKGRDETILGPEERLPDSQLLEYGIVRLEPGTVTLIQDLSIVNSRGGLNVSGRLTLDRVRVAGHWAGVFDGASEPLIVRNSHFEDCSNYGILTGPEGAEATVEDCTFFNAQEGVHLIGIETGIIRRCTFSADMYNRTFVMVTQGSYAVIEDCHFLESPGYYGVDVVSARATLNNNWFGLGQINVTARSGGYFEGSGNVLRGGTRESVRLMGYTAGASFHGNDIYNPIGSTVRLMGFQTLATKPLDLTDNWWGTVDPDSIQAGFAYENSNPEMFELLWQPFRTEPVPVEKNSMGGLKALYRRQ